jgi:hypothetical protein
MLQEQASHLHRKIVLAQPTCLDLFQEVLDVWVSCGELFGSLEDLSWVHLHLLM